MTGESFGLRRWKRKHAEVLKCIAVGRPRPAAPRVLRIYRGDTCLAVFPAANGYSLRKQSWIEYIPATEAQVSS